MAYSVLCVCEVAEGNLGGRKRTAYTVLCDGVGIFYFNTPRFYFNILFFWVFVNQNKFIFLLQKAFQNHVFEKAWQDQILR